MKKVISILSILMFSAGLSACNTMKGVGKDIERGGEKMQNSAEGARKGDSSGSGSSSSPSR
ncbi:hypothetical protein GCM10027343_31530 [Noviherbaspirillum agri]